MPWLIFAKVEDDYGKVVLRPFGRQSRGKSDGKDPTIQFQADDENGKFPKGALGVTEVKFEYKNKKDDDGNSPCPVLYPSPEPVLREGRPVYPFQLPTITIPRFPNPGGWIPPIFIPSEQRI